MRRTIAAVAAGALVLVLPAVPASGAPARYEAENATISRGLIETNHLNFSGTGFVNNDNVAGSYTQFAVNAPRAGTTTLTIRYSHGTATNRPADVSVNGAVVSAGLDFPGTANWDTWANKTLTVVLGAGANTIRVTGTTAAGPANFDYIEIDDIIAVPDYQAEDATISNGAIESNHAGFTGTGFVNYANAVGSYVEFLVAAPAAGNTNLTFRYANGTSANRAMSISVNGAPGTTVAFGSTGAWTVWVETSVTMALNAGANTIRATATIADGGPNLDRLTLNAPGGGNGPTAAELLAKVASCQQVSNGRYSTDSGGSPTIPVCQKTGAVFWQADMDIDCDGIRTAQCNEQTDCCFLPDTACHSSANQPLNAAQLPFVVLPSPSATWDYRNFNIGCGTVVAIIFNNQVLYAAAGDTGPTAIIGEASYASASRLGINPDPKFGGVDSGVTYIVFQGSQRVSPIESHAGAVALGETLARSFVQNN